MAAMSRAERERWATAAARWPHLQTFLSTRLSEYLFGEAGSLSEIIQGEIAGLTVDEKATIAAECWAFLKAFKERHDDREFLRDGFGIRGTVKTDDRGRGQTGLVRVKLIYDALVASIRRSNPDWVPTT